MEMKLIDFSSIVEKAWNEFGENRKIKAINDVSAKVSTNHVFKVIFEDKSELFAKLSYYGKYEHFVEDHTIINKMAWELEPPYDNLLALSITKDDHVFTYRYIDGVMDAWVVFYKAIKIQKKLPKRLNEGQIAKLGQELARFHIYCDKVKNKLPSSSKTLDYDIDHLLIVLNTDLGNHEFGMHKDEIEEQCHIFKENIDKLNYESKFNKIAVFVDWNIGNFSVSKDWRFFSRWDYDWFRISSRVMDFYFFSRVVSDIGDRTMFSYSISQLNEERFLLFLKEYHALYPLKKEEIYFIKEAYRFFILNYVIKDGRYFFHEIYATKLQKEAFEDYFPSIETDFDAEKIIKSLEL